MEFGLNYNVISIGLQVTFTMTGCGANTIRFFFKMATRMHYTVL